MNAHNAKAKAIIHCIFIKKKAGSFFNYANRVFCCMNRPFKFKAVRIQAKINWLECIVKRQKKAYIEQIMYIEIQKSWIWYTVMTLPMGIRMGQANLHKRRTFQSSYLLFYHWLGCTAIEVAGENENKVDSKREHEWEYERAENWKSRTMTQSYWLPSILWWAVVVGKGSLSAIEMPFFNVFSFFFSLSFLFLGPDYHSDTVRIKYTHTQ